MGILFRYIVREIVVSSLIGTLLFTFVLFLRSVGQLMELLIRPGASGSQVLLLFSLWIPHTLRFTIPIGVLVGVLVGLGRLSTDGEIIAMRAAGIAGRRCVRPIGLVALAGTILCAATTIYLNPLALQEFRRIGESMKISQATAEIQPRVFIESFPNTVLYVRDVVAGPVVRWKGVFLADMRDPRARGSFAGINAAVDGPRITVAEEALALPRPEQDRLQLHLPHAYTYEQSYDPRQYQSFEFFKSDQVLERQPRSFSPSRRPFDETPTSVLAAGVQGGEDQLRADIELHQRFALPIACLVLPMVGIPLAISSQRSGKSVGVVLSLVLVFIYYMILLAGFALALEGLLPVAPAVWMANLAFALVGAFMLLQIDAPNRRDITAVVSGRLRLLFERLRPNNNGASESAEAGRDSAVSERRRWLRLGSDAANARPVPFFLILDRYVLRTFLFYFAILVAAFVMIWFVFSFFELLTDMLAHDKMGLFIPYIYYLTPFLVYETVPLGMLVATLVCFGILAKHQELMAFKACGVSLYRLAAPILVAAVFVSGMLFALDYYYLPETNRKQDAIRDEIKGRPVRTFLRPDRQWTAGAGDRIFYHRFFDSANKQLAGVSVFDFEPEQFLLRRHISAERARWDEQQGSWVFENGWVRQIAASRVLDFEQFQSKAFPDLEEDPGYFLKEERQHEQMNWTELRSYIIDLTQSGFDTVRLQVKWHKKLAFPLFVVGMVVLAVPFSLVAGHRGALTGVALSIGLTVAYYAINAFFEQLGRANQLTPLIAAWAPALIFGLSGAYLFLRVKS